MTNSDTARAEALLGSELCGKWKLERVIGVGGMAAVYKARHRIGTEVAIKMLHPEIAGSPQLRARFRREAEVCGTLKHPGAVEVRDVDMSETGAPFMVMELLHGESLGDRLKRLKDIPLADALRFIDEALDVLAAAHAQGIIHRDIKLDNLFITDRDQLKVLDFGIASVREAQPMTVVGTRLGTLPYMPPEQIRGEDIDARVDLFAVGAVLFRLIAKRRIHQGKSEPELLAKMSTTPAPPLASVVSGADDNVCMLVDRALAFQRDGRYPDAATMRDDVQAVRRGEKPPYAARRLASEGPPNPDTGAVVAVDVAGSGPMSATAAASPQGAGLTAPLAAGPLSATAAASPTAQAAMTSGAVLSGAVLSGAVSATADATPFAGDAPTAMAPASAAAASAAAPSVGPAEPTAVSAGGAMAAVESTQVSVTPSPAAGPASVGAAALSAAPGHTLVSSGVPAGAVSVAPSVAQPAAAGSRDRRKGAPLGLMLAAGGGLLLLIILVIALLLGGDESSAATDQDGSDRVAESSESGAPSGDAEGAGSLGEVDEVDDGETAREPAGQPEPAAQPRPAEQPPSAQPDSQRELVDPSQPPSPAPPPAKPKALPPTDGPAQPFGTPPGQRKKKNKSKGKGKGKKHGPF